jgi:hypothetical protein
MESRDQLIAVLGLVIVFVVAGLVYINQPSQGEVAGVNSESSFTSALNELETSNDQLLDQGQQVVDQSIGVEVEAGKKAKEAIEKKNQKK